jgi:hypothetical protein
MCDDLAVERLERPRVRDAFELDPRIRQEERWRAERHLAHMQDHLEQEVNGRLDTTRSAERRLGKATDSRDIGEGRWEVAGIQQVELGRVKGVQSPTELRFEKTSYDEMARGFAKLREMEARPAASRLDWSRQRDSTLGLQGRDSYDHVYHCFYGDDNGSSITLLDTRDGYEIESGHHRLTVARSLGWEIVPARVRTRRYP